MKVKIGGVMDTPKLVEWCNEAVVARRGVCIPGMKRLAGRFPKKADAPSARPRRTSYNLSSDSLDGCLCRIDGMRRQSARGSSLRSTVTVVMETRLWW